MNVKTKKIILALVLVASVITIIGTVSFAYFTATGTTTNQTTTISTAKVSAVFSDADTGANAILNFGESFTKKFTITNNGNVPAHVKMYWKDLVNTYTKESLSYTLGQSSTGDAGSYTVFVGVGETKSLVPQSASASTKLLANDIEVPVGTTYYELTVTLNYLADVNQDSDLTAKFYTWFELQDINYEDNLALQTLKALKISSKGALTTDFGIPASDADQAGVYELADENDTTSYYFRGSVENNYVRFGKWRDDEPDVYVGHHSTGTFAKDFASLAACQADTSGFNNNCTLLKKAGKDMYWRIIRVNGDGSLRMIYAGTQAYANSAQGDDTFIIRGQVYNSLYNDAKYVGYMYSPINTTEGKTTQSTPVSLTNPNEASSNIKVALENWYANNLEVNYDQYINKDAIFCYDRSTPGKDATRWSDDTGRGYGKNNTAYGSTVRTRVWNKNPSTTPTFKCTQLNDQFTIEGANIGNKALSKPVGLISADEIMAAGSGEYRTEGDYYLKRKLDYWSGSPYNFSKTHARVFINSAVDNLDFREVNDATIAIAPVINLTAEYAKTLKGNGIASDPFRLSMN